MGTDKPTYTRAAYLAFALSAVSTSGARSSGRWRLLALAASRAAHLGAAILMNDRDEDKDTRLVH